MKLSQTSDTFRTPGWSYLIFFLATLASILLVATQPSPVSAQAARKQVLFINSYHPGYKFSDDVTRAISDTFNAQGNIDLRIEYLDTKRVDSPEYLEEVKNLYQIKYKNAKLDLIMSSDDAALNFLFKYADSLFPNVPVVFVGANFFDVSRLQGHERFTGISEEVDVLGTLDVALKIHPNTRQVVIVNDSTVTGQRISQMLEGVVTQYPQINFVILSDISMEDLRQRVGNLSADSLVLLTVFNRDKNGVFYEYDVYSSMIAEGSSVPVYATWDFSLGYGVVGGKLTSGYTEGQRAARMAIRVLNGEAPQSIPVEKQTQAQFLFDYKAMQKWGIDVSQLPADSTVIDRPVSFYEQNATIIWSVAAAFIVLLFVIVFLVINNNQRRLAQRELARANRELQDFQASLEKRVEERTRALTTVSEISTAASTILDIDILLQEVVNLSKERFGLYHAHIYLLDDAGENLVLTSGAGEVGQQMVAQGRSIPLSKEQSLVARAARERKGVTVNDVTTEPDFLPNPLLPNTRSELAVPMMVGEKVVGVFDVQSEQVGRFGEADIAVQTTLAAQIASAIQNARSYTEIQKNQELLSDALKIARIGNWEYDLEKDLFTFNDHFYSIFRTTVEEVGSYQISSAEYARRFVHPEDAPLVGKEIQRSIESKERVFRANLEHRIIFSDGEIGYIAVNITLERDENGKIVRWYGANQDITERRRVEELNKQRARQQEILNRVSQKILSTTSVEDAIKITARELGHVLGAKTAVELASASEPKEKPVFATEAS